MYERNSRDQDIISSILAGETYQSVADRYGVTRQRIEQIFKRSKNGPPPNRFERTRIAEQKKKDKEALSLQRAKAKEAKMAKEQENKDKLKYLVEKQGMSIARACLQIGISVNMATYWQANGLGLKSSYGRWRPGLKKRNAKAKKLYLGGMTSSQVGEMLGIHPSYVISISGPRPEDGE